MNTFTFIPRGHVLKGQLRTGKYANGGIQVMVDTEMVDYPGFFEPWCVLSVWLPTTPTLASDVFYGKHWAENEGMLEQVTAAGLIEPAPGVPAECSGFVQGIQAYRLKYESTGQSSDS